MIAMIALPKRNIKVPNTDKVIWYKREMREFIGIKMVFPYEDENGEIKRVTIAADSPKIDLFINTKLLD